VIFSPSWTDVIVLISEATVKLPTWAMHVYAETIIDSLRPSSLAFLDSYSTAEYISPEPCLQGPPIRYLSTQNLSPKGFDAQPFMPPNLLHSTTASFLSLLGLRCSIPDQTLVPSFAAILLPSSKTSSLFPTDFTKQKSTSIGTEWSAAQIMCTAHDYFFCTTGEQRHMKWGSGENINQGNLFKRASGQGEVGVYI
jgi:hypothetical protein